MYGVCNGREKYVVLVWSTVTIKMLEKLCAEQIQCTTERMVVLMCYLNFQFKYVNSTFPPSVFFFYYYWSTFTSNYFFYFNLNFISNYEFSITKYLKKQYLLFICGRKSTAMYHSTIIKELILCFLKTKVLFCI